MNFLDTLLNVRLSTLYISSQAEWIPQVGQNERDMLEYVVPKTAHWATIQLGVDIACHKHDQVVGSGYYHLFRLPTVIEERLSRRQREFLTWEDLPIGDAEQGQAYLTRLSEGLAIDPQEGPVHIGLYAELPQNPDAVLACVARHYLAAFRAGYQTFPYLS